MQMSVAADLKQRQSNAKAQCGAALHRYFT